MATGNRELMESRPRVSFVVPCYKLAHLLPECINSILIQTFEDFEILIMDDCSPDQTPQVAQSFQDPRIRYVRNKPNLGHLRNYNKGIRLAQGDYVWLISADDRLRKPSVLQHYVELMDKHPEVGYCICPAIALHGREETGLLEYSSHGPQDAIFEGREFLARILRRNTVIAASGMVRSKCYKKLGLFPLDLPYAGDWYLWCLFALHFDVAYFAEPMVNYRFHDLSMTTILTRVVRRDDDFEVVWRIRQRAKGRGQNRIVQQCESWLIEKYVSHVLNFPHIESPLGMTVAKCREEICAHAMGHIDAKRISGRLLASLADHHYWRGASADGRKLYALAIYEYPWMPIVWAKYFLLCLGRLGGAFRQKLFEFRTNLARKGVRN